MIRGFSGSLGSAKPRVIAVGKCVDISLSPVFAVRLNHKCGNRPACSAK
jgi:hypothetical protein